MLFKKRVLYLEGRILSDFFSQLIFSGSWLSISVFFQVFKTCDKLFKYFNFKMFFLTCSYKRILYYLQ